MRVRSLFMTAAFAGVGFFAPILSAQMRGGAMPGNAPTPTQPGLNGSPGMPNGSMDSTRQRVDDRQFVKEAAMSDLTQIELGKLAAQKGSSDAMKQFGQKLVDDHTKANELLQQVAAHDNIEMPNSLDSKHQSRVDKLSRLSGTDFDRAFLKDEAKDHQRDVSEFQSESRDGADPNVKNFASQTLPTLEAHLSTVKQLSGGE